MPSRPNAEPTLQPTLHQSYVLEFPLGIEESEQVTRANLLVSRMVTRCLGLLAGGADILVENPRLSYLWLLPEMMVLLGIP